MVRHLRASDLDEMAAICGDAELMRYVGDGRPIERERVSEWIEVSQRNYTERGFGCSAVIDKSDERFIGYCGLVYAAGSNDAEIIYAFKKECWGRGLATEVAAAMLDYGLGRHNLRRIIATIDPSNTASIRIVEKLGMRFEQERVDEHELPELVYAIER